MRPECLDRVGCLAQNIDPALLERPSLTLEHFEHGNIFGVQRVALDFLQPHGGQAPAPGLRRFCLEETRAPDSQKFLLLFSKRSASLLSPLPHGRQRQRRRAHRRFLGAGRKQIDAEGAVADGGPDFVAGAAAYRSDGGERWRAEVGQAAVA